MEEIILFQRVDIKMPKQKSDRKAKFQPKAEEAERPHLSKYIKKKPKHLKTKKEKNTYQFVGFSDRLKAIDVKVSHASLIDQSYMMDWLQGRGGEVQDENDLTQSNFIAFIKQEKVNNATLEFRRVWKELEPLAYSFPLVIMNRQKLVTKLLKQLQTPSLKVVYPLIIDLVIALIKDLRKDIYSDFMHEILPTVISILDCSNLKLLDAVFSLLSFSFKYLLNPLREDLKRFYGIYVVLLNHKNKYVRKFAAQSFSYVLRKIKFSQDIVNMLTSEVDGENEVLALVELLFEICSGEQDNLHSKAPEVLTSLLEDLEFISKPLGAQVVRYLYIKLTNQIDTQKQMPIFEILTSKLSESHIGLMGAVVNDTIKFKFGRRVSHELVSHFLQMIGQMMKSTTLKVEEQDLVAESLSLLYYFHHDSLRGHKLVQSQLFKMDESSVQSFFKILLLKAREISTQTDLEVTKVLDIKAPSQQVSFNQQSHQEKCFQVVPMCNKWALKQLNTARLSLLMGLIASSGEEVKIEIGGKCVQSLRDLINETSKPMDVYLLARFIGMCQDNKMYLSLLKPKLQSLPQHKQLDPNVDTNSNLVYSMYQPGINTQKMLKAGLNLFDMYNRGYEAHISQVCGAYIQQEITLTPENCQSLFVLKQALLKPYKCEPNVEEVQSALALNLSKNSRELRIVTLKVLMQFPAQDYLTPQEGQTKFDVDTLKNHYSGNCKILELMLKAEECVISLETEKTKSNLLRRVALILQSDLVPEVYVKACYRYALGCFWVKFSPIYPHAFDILSEVLRQKTFMMEHLNLFEHMSNLIQLNGGGEDNDLLVSAIQDSIKLPKVTDNALFLEDCTAEQDFVQVKDFYFNLTKAMHTNIDFALQDSALRPTLLAHYERFMESEFQPLNLGRRSKESTPDFEQQVVLSNQMDSQQFKQARRISYNKLSAWFELFSKASNLNKLDNDYSDLLISHYFDMLETADDNLQKLVLQGLIKVTKRQDFDNRTVKLPKYQKLLEGLTDDIKFKDMIPIIAHGTQVEHQAEHGDVDGEEKQKKQRNQDKIPKLADEDRLEVLPVIVKLLFSKLMKKKGKLNQKSLSVRRTIVYQFLSGLDPSREFPIFFKELLRPLGLSIDQIDQTEVAAKLRLVSFSQFIQFIGSVEVIFTQLGSLLNRDDYLKCLTNILILMLSQAKKFLGHLKEVEDLQEENLYQFVQKQCKMCVRKGLKILKQLYSRFSQIKGFSKHLSKLFYTELVQDQVPYFRERYVTERAQLIELVTTHWSAHAQSNYLAYPDVLPSLMQMLDAGTKIEPQVVTLHLGMIKNLVVSSIDSDADRLKFIQASKRDQASDQSDQSDAEIKGSESDDSMDGTGQAKSYSDVASKILQDNITSICQGLHAFWTAHSAKLRHALIGSRHQNTSASGQGSGRKQSKEQIQESIAMTNAVRDLTFIMSELSTYIKKKAVQDSQEEDPIVHGFLDMMVGLISQKHMLTAVSTFQQKSRLEELLMFGCQAITNLLSDKSSDKVKERISEMFLQMQSKKARELLAKGLHQCFNTDVTALLVDLNTVKKGVADIDYDYEKVLGGIQAILKLPTESTTNVNVLFYCVLALLKHQEYSVREYSLHALGQMLSQLSERLFRLAEGFVLHSLKITKDEMVMKTMLQALRLMVLQSQKVSFTSAAKDLWPLINLEHEDFFTQILSLQLPQRLKSLRKLQQVEIQPSTFSRALLPLVDYLIFDMKSQMENRRNTVRYSRDQSNLLQEESLQVYTSYAQKLNQSQYMSLVRKLLYKIEKATRSQNSVAAQKQDSQNEKVICKCLCKVLDGFNFPEVPDAVEILKKKAEEQVAHKFEVVEYSGFLKDMVGATLDEDEEEEDFKDGSDSEDSDAEEKEDVDMVQQGKVEDLQKKLQKKVLPLLQRHITTTKKDSTTIRSFVAVSIAKVIRHLPVDQFSLYLQKLINLIVIKGLRQKELNTRDKARRALLKVIEEVSPRFMTLIIQEMGNNLTRGFQMHVYLYTVHYTFNMMKEKMKVGQVTTQMIKLLSPLLLREMFGDLMEERKAADDRETQKKHIKESKAKKAMPIYEVFAQYIDFKTSFVELIQPIVKVLEDNPNHQSIQMIEDLLARVANSVMKNESITGKGLLPFIRQIIEKGVQMSMRLKINDEGAKRDYGAKADADFVQKSGAQLKKETHEVQIKWTKTSQQANDRKTQEVCGRVLANFGLQTLKKALSQKGLVLQGDEAENKVTKQVSVKQELVQMLDPFVQPLLDSFKTFYNPIVVQTLQVMIHVIHLGLPSFKTLLRKFLNRIFKLFQTNTSADNEFCNSLFKCTAELIRTYTVYNDLSQVQIKTLVQIIKSNLQNYSTQVSVFTCLKAILYRKFECADLYDLITNVQDMMLTSVTQSTRHTCSQIFITFVLEYPMEASRLDQHIQHLLKNLTYFDSDGRQQLLETLQTLVDKMPEQRFAQWQDLVFLTLFLRLVNESSTKCREIVTKILKKLVGKSQKRYIDTVWQMKESDNQSEVLVNGKLQLLSIIADCGKLQKQDISRTVQMLSTIIEESAQKALKQTKLKVEDDSDDNESPDKAAFLKGIGLESSDEEQAPDQEEEEPLWSNAYFSMSCLESIYTKCNQLQTLKQELAKHKDLKPAIVCLMWKSENYWVRLSCQRVIGFMMQDAKGIEELAQGQAEKLKLMYQMLGVLNFAYVTETLCTQLVENLGTLLKQISPDDLVKVYKKASYIGRRILGDKSDQTVFKHVALLQFYAKSLPYLQTERPTCLQDCCSAMLELVYRTYTDDQLSAQVRDPSTELVDQMNQLLDKDTFVQIFNQTQMQITQGRTLRKMKEKMLATSEEGLVKIAKKKAKRSVKQKEKHKQKVLMNQLTR